LVALVWIACTCARGDSDKPGAARAAVDASPKARLRRVSGDVRLKRAAGDDWVTAPDDTALLANDKVRTLRGGSAVIQFSNGSIVHLGADALIGIAETHLPPGRDQSDLTLLHGNLDAELEDSAKQSLSVNTPTATVRAGREIVFQ
jgi:hypothetical protein